MRYPVLLLALLTLACAGADTGTVNPPPPPPPAPPPPPGGTGANGEVVVIDQVSVPGSGGVLQVVKPGNKLDGLSITVRAGSYSAPTNWTVTALDSVHPQLPAGMVQLGPAIRVHNGAGYASVPMELSIPTHVGPDTAVSAFFYDQGSGTFELVPAIGREDSSLQVVTEHFSGSALLIPPGRTSLRTGAPPGPPKFGEIVIVVIATADLNIYQQRASSFRPGFDDWEFRNPRTLLAPNGICIGMTLSALYYHYMLKAARGDLHGKYDRTGALNGDNPRGIRLATVIHVTKDWDAAEGSITDLLVRANFRQLSWSYVQAASLSMSIQMTGLPQQVIIASGGSWSESHALVGYAVNNGTFSVADPSAPGIERTIQFANGSFLPISFAPNSDGTPKLYDGVFVVGATALTPMENFAGFFLQFDSHTIGNGYFPDVLTQFRDALDTNWRPLNGPVTTTSATLELRTLCPKCPLMRTSGDAPFRTHMTAFDPAGSYITDDGDNSDPGVQLVLPEGASEFGMLQDAAVSYRGDIYPGYQDFFWLPVSRIPFTVSVNRPQATPEDLLTFSAVMFGPDVPGAKYTWTFGDPTPPVTVTGNGQVTHSYAAKGTYGATVEVRDAAGVLLARGSVSVTIDTPIYTAWKVTSMTTTVVNDTRGVDTRTAQQGNLWLGLVIAHDPVSRYGFLWSTYQADSTFLYTAQSTNAAITLIARDTLLGPPFAPTTGYHPSIYWWFYGSYPTSAATLLTTALKGSNNTLTRGGTSCRPAYSARFSQTGTLSAGQVTGLDWFVSEVPTTGQSREPVVMFEYNITFNGEVATGTVTKTYRIYPDCNGNPEVTWSYQTTLTAQRIR